MMKKMQKHIPSLDPFENSRQCIYGVVLDCAPKRSYAPLSAPERPWASLGAPDYFLLESEKKNYW